MSCDWDVYCRDCDDGLGFDDANHQVDLMRRLIAHRGAIGLLAPLVSGDWLGGLELRTSYGRVDPSWFAHHAGHRLIPRDEYGGFDDECAEHFKCGTCAHSKRCHLVKGHEGEHAEKRP